jgi:hypothetical protein
MRKLYALLTKAMLGLILFACEEKITDLNPREDYLLKTKTMEAAEFNRGARAAEMEVIDFESYDRGTIVNEVYSNKGIGPVKVKGTNPKKSGKNAAMIFDSSAPTGGDWDLGTPHQNFGGTGLGNGGQKGSLYENSTSLGKLLIITENFSSGNPSDARLPNATLAFDFSELKSATVYSMHILDVEPKETAATVRFFDAEHRLIDHVFTLPKVGDNGVANFIFGEDGVKGVVKMQVTLNGSGAIDNIIFMSEEATEKGCTYAVGYWKTNSKYGPVKPGSSTWSLIGQKGEDSRFFKTSSSYIEVMNTEPKGNAYYVLAQQYIAARLNVLQGTSSPENVKKAMKSAEDLFNKYTPGDISSLKSGDALRKTFIETAELLGKYNSGEIGPGHCGYF